MFLYSANYHLALDGATFSPILNLKPSSWLCKLILLLIWLPHGEVYGQPWTTDHLWKADSLIKLRQYREALPSLRQAQSWAKQDGDLKKELEILFRLDEVYDMCYKTDERRRNLENMLVLGDKLGTYETHQAQIRMVDFLIEIGKSNDAVVFLQANLPLFEGLREYKIAVLAHMLMARAFQQQSKCQKALGEYDMAMEMAEEYFGDDRGLKMEILARRGFLYAKLGYFEEAESEGWEGLRILNGVPDLNPQDSILLAEKHLELSEAFWFEGDYTQALEQGEQGLALFRKISIAHPYHFGRALVMLALVFDSLDENEKAFALRTEAAELLANPKDKYMALNYFYAKTDILMEKNGLRGMDGGMVEEIDLLVERWSINPLWGYILLGEQKTKEGDLAGAREAYREAVTCAGKEYGLTDCGIVDLGEAYYALGNSFYDTGEFDSAAHYFHRAVQGFSSGYFGADLLWNPPANERFACDCILRAMSSKAEAIQKMPEQDWNEEVDKDLYVFQTYLRGAEIKESLKRDVKGYESKYELSLNGWRINEGVIESGLRLFRSSQNAFFLGHSFAASERTKSASLLESYRNATSLRSSLLPRRFKTKQDSLVQVLHFFKGRLLAEEHRGDQADPKAIDEMKRKILALTLEYRRLEEMALRMAGEENGEPGKVWGVSPSMVQDKLLADEEALIEYFVGRDSLYAFLITPKMVKVIVQAYPKELDSLIRSLNLSLEEPETNSESVKEGYQSFTEIAHRLFQILLEPVLLHVPSPKSLIIVPDQMLHDIPFEILLTKEPEKTKINYLNLPYLLLQSEVRYAYSATFLDASQKRPRLDGRINCLAMAPGNSSTRKNGSSGRFSVLRDGKSSLKGAHQEVMAMANLGFSGQYYLGETATEANFKEEVADYELVHLAFHGKADSENPFLSKISFAGPGNEEGEDEELHAFELEGVPLKAELVVLSACESGVGKQLDGEGELSLGHYFMASGAANVVMTQWRVPDKSSAILMELFYKYLYQELPAGKALHRAKLDFLAQADSRLAHPHHWAGYVSIGDSKSLPVVQTKTETRKILGIVFLALLGLLLAKRRRKRLWRLGF